MKYITFPLAVCCVALAAWVFIPPFEKPHQHESAAPNSFKSSMDIHIDDDMFMEITDCQILEKVRNVPGKVCVIQISENESWHTIKK